MNSPLRVGFGATAVQGGGGLHAIGLLFLLTFLFVSFSRAADILLPNLRVPLITSLGALTVVVLSGSAWRALSCRVGVWLLAFSAWLVLCVPFSFWPGGSVQFLTDSWGKSFLAFVIVAGLLRSERDCRLAMYTLAAATVLIVLMSTLLGINSVEGRLALEQGVLSGPNDLAQATLLGVPFLLLIAMTKTRGMVIRGAACICILGALFVTARTGSRAGLVAMICLAIMMWLSLSWGNRLRLLGALVLVVPLLLSLISPEQRDRYLTVFGKAAEDANIVELSAVASAEQRTKLFKQSVSLTLTHPIFGVGPGVFQAAAAADSEARGDRAIWHDTHNSYTQVSSEGGLPAFICYVTALVISLGTTRAVYKKSRTAGQTDLGLLAYSLWLSLLVFVVTACFSSVAYHMHFPLLAGLSVALSNSARKEPAIAGAAGELRRRSVTARATRRPLLPI